MKGEGEVKGWRVQVKGCTLFPCVLSGLRSMDCRKFLEKKAKVREYTRETQEKAEGAWPLPLGSGALMAEVDAAT